MFIFYSSDCHLHLPPPPSTHTHTHPREQDYLTVKACAWTHIWGIHTHSPQPLLWSNTKPLLPLSKLAHFEKDKQKNNTSPLAQIPRGNHLLPNFIAHIARKEMHVRKGIHIFSRWRVEAACTRVCAYVLGARSVTHSSKLHARAVCLYKQDCSPNYQVGVSIHYVGHGVAQMWRFPPAEQ